jgi:indolepyruvate ferredoxin oxidoreductase beta subunit
MKTLDKQRFNIAITAMGGQGGGVLADWIVSMAETANWHAQTTSVPGVAQRTGATIYYLELFRPQLGDTDTRRPVLSLSPASGDVDLVVAAELMEAGRAMQRGFVTPDRTTLIASSHRAYAVAEKESMGNAIANSESVHVTAAQMARRYICFDMAALAEQCRSVVSAVLFGAIHGSGVLPFGREDFEQAIRRGGVGVEASLAAFAAGAAQAEANRKPEDPVVPRAVAEGWHYRGQDAGIRQLLALVERDFTPALRPLLQEGVRRMLDHSDLRYAKRYVQRMQRLLALETEADDLGGKGWRCSAIAARTLGLWMAYEDTIRVADIKTRSQRFERLYDEVGIDADQVSYFTEFLHPRLAEVAETLPASLGHWVLRTGWAGRLLEAMFAGPKKLSTQSLGGFLSLYLVARLRPLRRFSLRDSIEQAQIDAWLEQLEETMVADYDLGCEVAALPELIKGYSKTRERGLRSFRAISAAARAFHGRPDASDLLGRLKAAALQSEEGSELAAALQRHQLGHLFEPLPGKQQDGASCAAHYVDAAAR